MPSFWEFEKLIRDTAARLSREELEEEFFDFYRPSTGISDADLEELARDFKEQHP